VSRLLSEAVPAAVGATIFYNIAPVVEAMAARRQAAGAGLGFGLLLRLVRQPLWLAGFVCELCGFALEVVALTVAPLILVQPLLAAGLTVVVLGGALFLGERLTRWGVAGMASLVGGVVLLTASVARAGDAGVLPAPDRLWPAVAACTVAGLTALVGALRAERSASTVGAGALFGASAGVFFTVAAVATRYLGLQVHHLSGSSVVRVFTGPAPYLLAVSSIVATSLLQRGLQAGTALSAVPAMTALSAILPVPAGLVLFGENLPTGWWLPLFCVALAFTLAGIAQLGSERAVQVAFAGGDTDPPQVAADTGR